MPGVRLSRLRHEAGSHQRGPLGTAAGPIAAWRAGHRACSARRGRARVSEQQHAATVLCLSPPAAGSANAPPCLPPSLLSQCCGGRWRAIRLPANRCVRPRRAAMRAETRPSWPGWAGRQLADRCSLTLLPYTPHPHSQVAHAVGAEYPEDHKGDEDGGSLQDAHCTGGDREEPRHGPAAGQAAGGLPW